MNDPTCFNNFFSLPMERLDLNIYFNDLNSLKFYNSQVNHSEGFCKQIFNEFRMLFKSVS